MNTFLITYKLDNPDSDFTKISKCLKGYTNWAKPFDRVWIVKTWKSTIIVRDELETSIGEKGKILVMDITNSRWAAFALDPIFVSWLRENV